jgi:hypothetical protein
MKGLLLSLAAGAEVSALLQVVLLLLLLLLVVVVVLSGSVEVERLTSESRFLVKANRPVTLLLSIVMMMMLIWW